MATADDETTVEPYHIDILQMELDGKLQHWLDPYTVNSDRVDEIRKKNRAKWLADLKAGKVEPKYRCMTGTPQERLIAELEDTLALLKSADWDESKHPRAGAAHEPGHSGGEFASVGGGGGEKEPAERLDPEVVDVGGDKWNRTTAVRLEREYQAVKAKLTTLADNSVAHSKELLGGNTGPVGPKTWGELSQDGKDEATKKYTDEKYKVYFEQEKEKWLGSGMALDDAKINIAYRYNEDLKSQTHWMTDAINDYQMQRALDGKPKLPFTPKQLMALIKLKYASDKKGTGKLSLDVDPGHFPKGEVENLSKFVGLRFDLEAQELLLSPPPYVYGASMRMAGESWKDLTDNQKFAWTDANTLIVLREVTGALPDVPFGMTVKEMPTKYDPLQSGGDTDDYKRTHTLARYMSIERAREVLKERGLPVPSRKVMSLSDQVLWDQWKSSSTTDDGKLLQVATAKELGGRLNEYTAEGIQTFKVMTYADKEYKDIGGFKGIKAY